MKIAIAGAGISGLTAALALVERGAKEIFLFERATELGEIGAGIQLAPNAVRLLHQLGFGDSLAEIAHSKGIAELRRAGDNQLLVNLPSSEYFFKHYGYPAYQVLRADLHALLLNALKVRQVEIQLGKELIETQQSDYQVQLGFADGSKTDADILIGADGLGSMLSAQLFPEQPPTYTGAACWRALLDQEKAGLTPIEKMSVWTGEGRHLVAYPVGRSALLNLVAVIRKDHWEYPHRVAPSSKNQWLNAFDGCCEQVAALIEHAPESDLWGLFEQKSLPRWHKGNQVLIGDAAHAMLPNLAQGAAQGMEDAVLLAEILSGVTESAEIESALVKFYLRRRERVSKVQKGARWNLDFFHQSGSPKTTLRDGLMRIGGSLTTSMIARKYHWLYSTSV